MLTFFAATMQPIAASPRVQPPIAQNTNLVDIEALFQQALRKTQKQDFRGAIADLNRVASLFTQDGKLEQAYRAKALAEYISWDLKDTPPPNWYKSGSCQGDPICQYIVTHVSPNFGPHRYAFSQNNSSTGPDREINDYGGILMLLKPIRYRPSSTGGQTPVNAVLDVQIIPQLMEEEYVNISGCSLDRKPDDGIVALVKIAKSDRDAEEFTKIRQAWRIDLKTEKIETITTKGITCVNPCPGGC
jgi:hypothetical protein